MASNQYSASMLTETGTNDIYPTTNMNFKTSEEIYMYIKMFTKLRFILYKAIRIEVEDQCKLRYKIINSHGIKND